MKSPNKNIKIDYWMFPDGTDFNGIEEFIEEINKDYFLTVSKKRTDALGGGLYDFIIQISEDLSIMELAKSYLEDGVKLYVGYHVKTIYSSIKKLLDKNKELHPNVEQISIKFKDCKITLYEIYDKGIDEAFDEIMKTLFEFASSKKRKFKKIKQIHIPIFNHPDEAKLCKYRVKLNIDENIPEFKKDDYFNFWGINLKNKKLIYNVEKDKLINKKFYTQNGYDKLYEKKM